MTQPALVLLVALDTPCQNGAMAIGDMGPQKGDPVRAVVRALHLLLLEA